MHEDVPTGLEDLTDWTVTELATSPTIDKADQRNAELELERRKKEENDEMLNLDESIDAERELREKGYNFLDDKLIYQNGETLEQTQNNRLTEEAVKNMEEEERSHNYTAGAAAFKAAFEDSNRKEKIPQSGKDYTKTRKYFDYQNYNNRNKDEMRKAEVFRTSTKKSSEQILDDIEARLDTEINHRDGYERALDKAKFRIKKHAREYLTNGFEKNIRDGKLVSNPQITFMNGFFDTEIEELAHDVDHTEMGQFVDDVMGSHVVKEAINPETVTEAEKDAIYVAIYTGATIKKGGVGEKDQLIFSLPINKRSAEEINGFIKEKLGGEEGDLEEAELASYDGFVNIIETIKDNEEFTEEGMHALDWYFDNFGYQKHMREFIDFVDEYGHSSDIQFNKTLDDFLSRRKEYEEYLKSQEKQQEEEKILESIVDTAHMNEEEFQRALDMLEEDPRNFNSNIKEISENAPDGDLFWGMDHNRPRRDPKIQKKLKNWPSIYEKIHKVREEVEKLKGMGIEPSFGIRGLFDEDEEGKTVKGRQGHYYAVIRFNYNNRSNMIAAPISKHSDALFCLSVEQTDNEEELIEKFKTSIRNRDDSIMRFVHNGYSRRGYGAVIALWERVWRYLERAAE